MTGDTPPLRWKLFPTYTSPKSRGVLDANANRIAKTAFRVVHLRAERYDFDNFR